MRRGGGSDAWRDEHHERDQRQDFPRGLEQMAASAAGLA
jgi:hypothetical protein